MAGTKAVVISEEQFAALAAWVRQPASEDLREAAHDALCGRCCELEGGHDLDCPNYSPD